ncbi:YibE/F family protein [Anaerosporobacter faecicola]|uniref:YibE/F family protein n=1 Tax=Anaerosporobacter faecicola TaxID=2718714 RepID=UPI0014394376|nr:YibE/F family protein [Anaerosporobacter faecicola]
MAKANNTDLPKKRISFSKVSLTKIITFLIACLVIGAVVLHIDDSKIQSEEKNMHYYKGVVQKVVVDNTQEDPATEGVRRGSQTIQVKLTNGPYKGKVVSMENYLSAQFNVYAKKGTKIMVRAILYEDGPNFSVYNYDRSLLIYGFIGLFMVLLCVIGGRKGFFALLSLVLTLLAVVKILLPLLLLGYPTLPTTIGIIAFTTIISFILIDGINKKTSSAMIGTIAGVVLAGFLAYLVGKIGHISGYQMQEAESLYLIAGGDSGIQITNLLTAGILIASLGAVMDVAMSIASAIHELKEVNEELTTSQLFRSGMNIGKDAMGTMANTLILAFTGSSLNLLLMIYSYGIPYEQLLNTDSIAIEIIRGIAGSIGIVLTVPIVALISANIEKNKKHRYTK